MDKLRSALPGVDLNMQSESRRTAAEIYVTAMLLIPTIQDKHLRTCFEIGVRAIKHAPPTEVVETFNSWFDILTGLLRSQKADSLRGGPATARAALYAYRSEMARTLRFPDTLT